MADDQDMRDQAGDAAYWIVEVMRGSSHETQYAQAVMEKARDHIQRLALLLYDAANPSRLPEPVAEIVARRAIPSKGQQHE